VTARSGWSLRARLTKAIIGVLVLLLAFFATFGSFIYEAKQQGDELVHQWDPAYTISQNLLSALINQETGVRGYALGRDPALLEPYDLYSLLESGAEGTLRKYLLDYPDLLEKFYALRDAVEYWHENVGDPVIAQVQAGDPAAAEHAASPEARAAFDQIRDMSGALTRAIGDRRSQVAEDRERAFTLGWVAAGFGTAILLLTALWLARGLRRQVLRPVSGLVAQTRKVADGDLTRQITQDGPLEIAGLAADVDLMRARLATQLENVEQSRLRLQQRTAELARSNANLEQFAYVASHDLSEPLRKVTNFSQLLERQYADQLDDRARQYIHYMVDGAKRMQALINDLLDFSRVGRSTEHFVPVDLDRALDRAVANLEEQVAESGARIERGPLPTVPGDLSLLTALLQNLVGNAVKYHSPERPPQVRVSAERQGGAWVVTVDDNGIGIDQQYADRIFAIFQRLHLRDQYAGTGIGLALCRRIVEFHGGRLWLAEKTEPGARFRFTLPVTQVPTEAVDDDEPALRAAP
jgi:signal transduction histidine kinase